jgi:hypothetical protein
VDGRIELHAGLIDAGQAVRLQRVLQLGGDRGERAVREVTVLAGGVDVVQHRQQGVQDADDGHLPCHGAVAFNALAVVDVLGLQAEQVVLQLRRLAAGLSRNPLRHGLLGGHLNLVEDFLSLGEGVAVGIRTEAPDAEDCPPSGCRASPVTGSTLRWSRMTGSSRLLPWSREELCSSSLP